jgi:endonuclease/exonuclease/phosphatase family metal-dependent hydrolase
MNPTYQPAGVRQADDPEGRPRAPSWTWKRIAGHGGGWRIDHIFASSQLRPLAWRYHHAWSDQQLSDHSALEVDVA